MLPFGLVLALLHIVFISLLQLLLKCCVTWFLNFFFQFLSFCTKQITRQEQLLEKLRIPLAGSRVVHLKWDFFLKIALDGRCYVKRTEYGFEVCKKKTTFTHVVLHCCYQTALLPSLWMLLLVLLGQTQKMSVVYSLSANPFTK